MIVFLTYHYFCMFSNNVVDTKVEKEEQKYQKSNSNNENIVKEQKEEKINEGTYFSKILKFPEIPFSQMKFPKIPDTILFQNLTK